jgi:HrpA-like RNA helicase
LENNHFISISIANLRGSNEFGSSQMKKNKTNMTLNDDSYGALNPYTSKPYSAKYHTILKKRQTLPIWKYRSKFLQLLAHNQIIILVGETGSGKTTQIPQFVVKACNDFGSKWYAHNQEK